jgi:hypothetical protein
VANSEKQVELEDEILMAAIVIQKTICDLVCVCVCLVIVVCNFRSVAQDARMRLYTLFEAWCEGFRLFFACFSESWGPCVGLILEIYCVSVSVT